MNLDELSSGLMTTNGESTHGLTKTASGLWIRQVQSFAVDWKVTQKHLLGVSNIGIYIYILIYTYIYIYICATHQLSMCCRKLSLDTLGIENIDISWTVHFMVNLAWLETNPITSSSWVLVPDQWTDGQKHILLTGIDSTRYGNHISRNSKTGVRD